MSAGADSFCRFLEWDSAFFGKRIASAIHPRLDAANIRAALDWARAHTIDCMYVLTDERDRDTAAGIEAAGGRLVDVRMTFQRGLAGEFSADPRIRVSRESDISPLRVLAGRSHSASRFYSDGNFPRDRCDELYATWIEKSCRGWADRVFVAEHDGKPAGYLSCHIRAAERGEIGIVAVAPDAQGRGLGRALLDAALAYFAELELECVTVVTQGRNDAARKLYNSRGFETVSVHQWHHVWFDAGGARL